MTHILKEEITKSTYNHNLPTIKKIPDELWDEVKKALPRENPFKTVGRPIVPYRKVLDILLYVLSTGCECKENASIEYGFGSVCHRRFHEWNDTDVFKKKHGLND